MLGFGENILPAHILDTPYTLTVEMECHDCAPRVQGMVVLLFEIILLFLKMR